MAARLESIWQILIRRSSREAKETLAVSESGPRRTTVEAVEIAPNDPMVAYFESNPNLVEIDKLNLESPALQALEDAGVRITMPMVSQGELIGLLNLGPRRSEQDYSADDRKLLGDLAAQAAPVVRVAQLVRQQQAETQEKERIEHELRVARVIQQTLLPKEVPSLRDWKVAAYYRPAREVGGDFYDFIDLPGDKLGFVVGDVTDKGVPAALVTSFWPEGNRFYAPFTGIAPGDVAVLNLSAPGGMTLSTGVMVIYADEESFTFMSPEGHMFSGWITFSAHEREGATVAQTQVLIRANDPLWELVMRVYGFKKEDEFWMRP